MNKQIIIFDMDDTLIHCNKYFDMIISQFADQMETWFHGYGITSKQVIETQHAIDIVAVEIYGFTLEHFPQSFVDTYIHYCNETGFVQTAEDKDWLYKLGSSVYDQEFEAFPDMVNVLTTLQSEGHLLCMYTGGVASVQQKKVDKLQLATFFEDRIYIAQHKKVEILEEILVTNNYDRSRTWMIGNSIRTDIVPALQCGLHALYIPAKVEWKYNIIEIDVVPKGTFLTLSNLPEVPQVIAQHTHSNLASSN